MSTPDIMCCVMCLILCEVGRVVRVLGGLQGPWQLCIAIAKTGKWYRALLVQVTHFNVNHLCAFRPSSVLACKWHYTELSTIAAGSLLRQSSA